MHNMKDEEFIREIDNGQYAITNMGALLFAKDLNKFSHLKRKAVRMIQYKGTGRTNAIREQVFTQGYAQVVVSKMEITTPFGNSL